MGNWLDRIPLWMVEEFFDRVNVWKKKNTFEVPVQGVDAVEDNEFVTKAQLPVVNISGTENKVAKFGEDDSLEDSTITDDGTRVSFESILQIPQLSEVASATAGTKKVRYNNAVNGNWYTGLTTKKLLTVTVDFAISQFRVRGRANMQSVGRLCSTEIDLTVRIDSSVFSEATLSVSQTRRGVNSDPALFRVFRITTGSTNIFVITVDVSTHGTQWGEWSIELSSRVLSTISYAFENGITEFDPAGYSEITINGRNVIKNLLTIENLAESTGDLLVIDANNNVRKLLLPTEDGVLYGIKDRELFVIPASSGGDVTQAGNNDFTGSNSFTTPPTSAQDADASTELVRYSQILTIESDLNVVEAEVIDHETRIDALESAISYEQIDIELTTEDVYQVVKTLPIAQVSNIRVSAFSLDQGDAGAVCIIQKLYDGTDSIMRRFLFSGSNLGIEVDLNGTEIRAAITGVVPLPHNVRFKLYYE